jgi:hypothetical protein
MMVNYSTAVAVTTSDTVDFTQGRCSAIYVGVSGDVVAVVGGTAITFKAAPVGILPVVATRINATSTTATNMVALYGA